MLRRCNGVVLAEAERRHQVREGFDLTHDLDPRGHSQGELVQAARAYLDDSQPWPKGWQASHDKRGKHSDLRRLTIAAALLLAEINRITSGPVTLLKLPKLYSFEGSEFAVVANSWEEAVAFARDQGILDHGELPRDEVIDPEEIQYMAGEFDLEPTLTARQVVLLALRRGESVPGLAYGPPPHVHNK